MQELLDLVPTSNLYSEGVNVCRLYKGIHRCLHKGRSKRVLNLSAAAVLSHLSHL